mgnify:CR=1 FL=1
MTFTSSNPSAVTVDSNGVVTGMGRIDSSVITVTDKILGSSYSFTVRVAQSADTEITVPMIVSGYGHTLALRADGTVWAWGDNTYGQLGVDKTTTFSTKPVKAGVFDGVKFV